MSARFNGTNAYAVCGASHSDFIDFAILFDVTVHSRPASGTIVTLGGFRDGATDTIFKLYCRFVDDAGDGIWRPSLTIGNTTSAHYITRLADSEYPPANIIGKRTVYVYHGSIEAGQPVPASIGLDVDGVDHTLESDGAVLTVPAINAPFCIGGIPNSAAPKYHHITYHRVAIWTSSISAAARKAIAGATANDLGVHRSPARFASGLANLYHLRETSTPFLDTVGGNSMTWSGGITTQPAPASIEVGGVYSQQPDGTDGVDSYIADGASADANFGTNTTLLIGSTALNAKHRGLFKFDLTGSAAPSHSNVVSSQLELTASVGATNAKDGRVTKVLRNWIEGDGPGGAGDGATWNGYDSVAGDSTLTPWTTPGADGNNTDIDNTVEDITAGALSTGAGVKTFNTVACAEDAIANESGQLNIRVAATAAHETNSQAGRLTVAASDNATAGNRPRHVLSWVLPVDANVAGRRGFGLSGNVRLTRRRRLLATQRAA